MKITGDMLISDVLSQKPASASIFSRHGLGCPSCLAAGMESLSSVATMHEVDLPALLAEINDLPDTGLAQAEKE